VSGKKITSYFTKLFLIISMEKTN